MTTFNVRYERFNGELGFMEVLDQKIQSEDRNKAEQTIRDSIPSLVDIVSVMPVEQS